jgi:large subunit ribosomal protein L25
MSEHKLIANKRNETGKKQTRALRRDDKIPGIFYFHGQEAVPLTFDAKELTNLLVSKPALISLYLEGESKKEVVTREVQRDPITSAIRHVDFLGIKRGEKITLTVPLYLKGEAKGVKLGGMLEHLTREIEIECMPKDIPERIEIDVSQLDIGDSIHIGDLKLNNIKILTQPDIPIANLVLPKVAAAAAEEAIAEEEEKVGEGKEKQEEESD